MARDYAHQAKMVRRENAMRYWWVNHNQTFRQEFLGGYIWCPKKNRNGQQNHFYETVREVAPGDVIFSFADARIQGFGFAKTHCYSCPRPNEFGRIGDSWDHSGWRVDIAFQNLVAPFRPIDYKDLFAPLLPKKYSPIRSETGYGNQGAYFSEVTKAIALLIANLSDPALIHLFDAHTVDEMPVAYETAATAPLSSILEWEDQQQRIIESSTEVSETTRKALVYARRGQGLFKQRVSEFEKACRITRVNNPAHLIASHIKPWRESDNEERLSAGNGLLLTPSIDHLFDRGFITFADSGEVVISPVADKISLERMGVNTVAPLFVGNFNTDQKYFLNFHREEIFLKAAS